MIRRFFKDYGFAWLLAICLVVQAAASSFYAPALAKTTLSNDGSHWTVIICTGTGQREITLDADGNLVNDVSQSTMDMLCPLCVISQVDLAFSYIQQPLLHAVGYQKHVQSLYKQSVTDLRPDNLHCLDPPKKA